MSSPLEISLNWLRYMERRIIIVADKQNCGAHHIWLVNVRLASLEIMIPESEKRKISNRFYVNRAFGGDQRHCLISGYTVADTIASNRIQKSILSQNEGIHRIWAELADDNA